eukprot:scaffold48521_cov29-Tisochrysis_lutea.AAC.1
MERIAPLDLSQGSWLGAHDGGDGLCAGEGGRITLLRREPPVYRPVRPALAAEPFGSLEGVGIERRRLPPLGVRHREGAACG